MPLDFSAAFFLHHADAGCSVASEHGLSAPGKAHCSIMQTRVLEALYRLPMATAWEEAAANGFFSRGQLITGTGNRA